MMITTQGFAYLLLIWLLVSSFSIIFNYKLYQSAVNELLNSNFHKMVVGTVSLMFGTIIVSFHGFYDFTSWPVIITIFGWLSIFKAIMFLVFSNNVNYMAQMINNKTYIYTSVFFMLLVAAFLFYKLFI